MNICFLTSEFPNLRSGGVENVTYRLILALAARGNDVGCISLGHPPIEMDVPFRHLCVGQIADIESAISNFLYIYKIDVVINQSIELKWEYAIKAIRPLFPNIKFIKSLHTDPAYAIKAVRDCEPSYISSGDLDRMIYRFSPITMLRRFRRHMYLKSRYRDWIKLYDAIVLLSSHVMDEFKGIAGVKSCNKLVNISNPVDLIGRDVDIRKQNLVLYVGRLHHEAKRPDRLLAVWRKISKLFPDWELVFVGDGLLRPAMEQYCTNNGLINVRFVGQADPAPYYAKASILCISSTSEGFSLVCAEAISSGVIPIAFNSYRAVNDLIRDEYNGVLVSPFNLDEYAKKLAKIMGDRAYSEKIRDNIINSTYLYKMSMDSVVNQWNELFYKLCM
ncbi:glycosyltransferase [Bacteroides acidifaciens]|uniref:glycosyltransferase n=1 Tax=Bacteroides acidifaciens TaxID=85831 RepID=UPI002608A6B0|nr:glycosyltransferase [Bacteroides acidifaciens]